MVAIYARWSVPLEEVRRIFVGVGRGIENAESMFEEIAGVMASASEDAFAAQATPAGAPWPELSEERIEQRTKDGTWPGMMLQHKGILAASVATESGADYALIGSPMEYAAAQNLGRPEINLPAREFIGLGEIHEQDILEIVARYTGGLLE